MTYRLLICSIILFGAAPLILSTPSWAASDGSVPLSSIRVFQRFVSGKHVTCGEKRPGRWIAGMIKRSRFIPYSGKISELKAKLRVAPLSRRSRIESNITSFKTKLAQANPSCRNGPPGSTGNGNPTPTPAPSGGNFDSAGNVTASGKAAFGIPNNLSANITTGRTALLSNCGCHGEYTNRSFSQLRSSTSQSPMSFTSATLPDPVLANITAYLNRFRP